MCLYENNHHKNVKQKQGNFHIAHLLTAWTLSTSFGRCVICKIQW